MAVFEPTHHVTRDTSGVTNSGYRLERSFKPVTEIETLGNRRDAALRGPRQHPLPPGLGRLGPHPDRAVRGIQGIPVPVSRRRQGPLRLVADGLVLRREQHSVLRPVKAFLRQPPGIGLHIAHASRVA